MTDGATNRPRRAANPGVDEHDDTPTVELHHPRRGHDAPTESETWQPTAVETSPIPPPSTGGRRFSSAALPEDHRATARRSATSALSPAEPVEPIETVELPTAVAPVVPPDTQVSEVNTTRRPQKLRRKAPPHDKFSVAFVAVAAFAALALVIGMVFSALNPTPQASPTATSNPTASAPPSLTIADLWTADDATSVASGTVWRITQTLSNLTATSPQVACMAAITGSAKPKTSAQRTLSSEGDTHYAALHQLDNYADETAATTVFAERAAKLAACDDTPAYIVGATTVTGLGAESVQATIAYEAATREYHTVLLTRTGTLISMFDVAHPETATPVADVINAARPALTRSCARFGTCPSAVAITDAAPAKTTPNGWLVVSDWPRVTPGSGRWTATEPVELKSVGTACENLTLETVAGPTARKQRTFLLTQDTAAPQGFGADELLLTFPDATASSTFAKTLGDNIAACGQRLQTATVTDTAPIQAKAGTADVSGRSFTITQATAQDKKVVFQVAVLSVNQYVVYVLINTNESFKLSTAQLTAVASRAGQRTTQLP